MDEKHDASTQMTGTQAEMSLAVAADLRGTRWSRPVPKLMSGIDAAPWRCVDCETTALSPFAAPVAAPNGADPTPRLRVVTIAYQSRTDAEILKAAFDLDALEEEERRTVLYAALNPAGLYIGHNDGFDLLWMRHTLRMMGEQPPPLPRHIVDTMLMARLLTPEVSLARRRLDIQEGIESPGVHGFALENLALTLTGTRLDKRMQNPVYWMMPPPLSEEAYNYCTGDVITPVEVLCAMLDAEPGHKWLDKYHALRKRDPWVAFFERKTAWLVLLSEKGTPFDPEVHAGYVDKCRGEMCEAAKTLATVVPELQARESHLRDPSNGTSHAIADAIAAWLDAKGVRVEKTPRSASPKIGVKDLRIVGAHKATPDFFQAWEKLQAAKYRLNAACEMAAFAGRAPDGRVHSLFEASTSTMRLASSLPNGQNYPRDNEFRRQIHAGIGNKIVALDFGALDLRTGAALALRAQTEIIDSGLPLPEESIEELRAVNEQARRTRNRRAIALSEFRYRRAQVAAKAPNGSPWSALRDAFALGIDPHLATAIRFNGDDPQTIFGGKSAAEVASIQQELRQGLEGLRRVGKVGNLGLLYFMQARKYYRFAVGDHGMAWTPPQAARYRTAWFEANPEIGLWQAWTALRTPEWVEPDGTQWWRVRTLSGRMLAARGLSQALNYQDQGSGAEIMDGVLDHIHRTKPELAQCIINQVHDEFVLEVPAEAAHRIAAEFKSVMEAVAGRFFAPWGIPVEASVKIADSWEKS